MRCNINRIAYRLDAPVTHLLLDEFQDTSLIQWSAIQPFAEDITKREDRSFFCVGDVKQAIYGWRGGVPELMDAAFEHLPNMTEERLNCSYRSSRIVIDTANAVFGTLGKNAILSQYPVVANTWSRHFETHTTVRTELHGHCRLMTAPLANEGEDPSDVTLQFAAAEVARLHCVSPNRSIGVLVRRNQAVARMIYELRYKHGVAASEEGGNPLTDSVAVQLILSLLRLTDHPGDTVARFHVAQSPLGAIIGLERYDDEAAVDRLSLEVRQHLMTLGYGQTIYAWVKALADACDQRELNRLLQLVELAYAYEPMATERTMDFLEYVCAKKVEDPSAAPVRVMTIHQAKGLQFDVVVLSELDINLEGQTPTVVVGRAGPTGPIETVCRYVKKELWPLLPVHFQEMFAAHSTQMVSESLCLLYVAMTRAIHALHIIIAPSKPNEKNLPKTFAGVLRAALCDGEKAGPEAVLYEHGMPDWRQKQMGQTIPDESAVAPMETEEPEMPAVHLRDPAFQRTRGLERLRPSHAEVGPIVHLADRMRSGASQGMVRGVLLHAWLEQIEWLDDGEPDETALRRIGKKLCNADLDPDEEIKRFRRMLEMPQTSAVLSRRAYDDLTQVGFSDGIIADLHQEDVALRVFREHPFAIRENDAVVHGVIDRLILFCHRDNVLAGDILDFKSDSLFARDGTEGHDIVERYRPQLALYRRAIARQFKLDVERVTVRLLFLQLGEVWRVRVS